MPQYAYTARNTQGEDVVGTMTAGSKEETLGALAEKSLFPIRVEDVTPARAWWHPPRRVKPAAVASVLSQLGDLLENGVPLLKSLEVLASQAAQPALGEVLADVRDRVAEGASLDAALAEHPAVFGELAVSMVRAGSEGAFLEDALKRTAGFLEHQEELKSRISGAMFYPAFLAAAGAIITVALLVFFVPKFAELFARLEEQGGLPTATVILLGLSDFLGRYGLFVLVAVAGAVWGLRRAMVAPRGRALLDRWRLKIPLVGPIFLGAALSRFCRVLGTLLKNGVPLLKSLEISSASAGNVVLADAIRASAENISSGQRLAQPLAACGLFPRSIMAMITIAEESNNLDEVLVNVADGIDRKTSRQVDIMVRMVEPVMLLVMGCLIGFVMVALLLPVFDMSSAMG